MLDQGPGGDGHDDKGRPVGLEGPVLPGVYPVGAGLRGLAALGGPVSEPDDDFAAKAKRSERPFSWGGVLPFGVVQLEGDVAGVAHYDQ